VVRELKSDKTSKHMKGAAEGNMCNIYGPQFLAEKFSEFTWHFVNFRCSLPTSQYCSAIVN